MTHTLSRAKQPRHRSEHTYKVWVGHTYVCELCGLGLCPEGLRLGRQWRHDRRQEVRP